tara:strand:- start:360 stop:500 length:141 start_codon:yes stop_codon:yes gene_type:complete
MLINYVPEIIKKLPSKIKNNKVKTGILLGLSAYWGVIVFGTFNSLN